MSSSKEFGQDYLARVRYRNDLPPPPGAPKLLNIPHDGMDRFLKPGYASRLARDQPLNIDVDAEGGMPIDMVGMPGYFQGDESAIMAPDHAPPVDPRDAALLRPLASLGKPASTAGSVSFLRRTEYIGTQHGVKAEIAALRASAQKSRPDAPIRRPEVNKDDPMYIKKYIMKGFDIAYPESRHIGPDTKTEILGLKANPAEMEAWKKPVHPTNASLKPIDFYPIIPDLDSSTDNGGFILYAFKKAPISSSTHDDRMTTGLFRPPPMSDEEAIRLTDLRNAHKQDPVKNKDPGDVLQSFDFYIPHDKSSVTKIKSKFDTSNPDRDDPALYTDKTEDGVNSFRYDYLRTYDTINQRSLENNPYNLVAMTLVDPQNDTAHTGRLQQKAAYYYPIIQTVRLEPQRALDQSKMQRDENWEKADQIYVTVEDADDGEIRARLQHRLPLDRKLAKEVNWVRPEKVPKPELELEPEPEPKPKRDAHANVDVNADADADVDADADGEPDVDMLGASAAAVAPPNGIVNVDMNGDEDEEIVETVEDQDASGDEDVEMDAT